MRRPSPALVIACLALGVALGGTSYATVLNVPRNSVGTPQLQRNAVKAAKIAPNAVRTGHVLDGSLLTADFKAGQIPQGPKGDKGDKGDAGAPGATNVRVRTATGSVAANSTNGAVASCQAGERAMGGGIVLATIRNQDAVLRSYPTLGSTTAATAGQVPTAWFARVFNSDAAAAHDATTYVVCASP